MDAGFNFLPILPSMGFYNSDNDIWEEIAYFFTTAPTCAYVQLRFGRYQAGADQHPITNPTPPPDVIPAYNGEIFATNPVSSKTTGNMWIDDFYLGTGFGFEQAPTTKVGFTGTRVKIDALGNRERWNGSTWEDYIPVIIFKDNTRDLSVYANQGFNTTYIAVSSELTACAAVGMYGWLYTNIWTHGFADQFVTGSLAASQAGLASTLADIVSDGNEVNLAGYYYDNENDWGQRDDRIAIHDQINQWGVDNFGGQTAPQWALEGTFGVARGVSSTGWPYDVIDEVGNYAEGTLAEAGGVGGASKGYFYNWNIEGMTKPATLLQAYIANNIRFIWYRHAIQGCKGITYYADDDTGGDGGFGHDVTLQPWWPTFPALVTEMTVTLKELWKTEHWVDWDVTADKTHLQVEFGGRDLGGVHHLVVLNLLSTPQTIEFTVSGLDYTPGIVRNFFDDVGLTTVSGGKFSLNVPGLSQTQGTMVVYLDTSTPGPGPGDPVNEVNNPYIVDSGKYTSVPVSVSHPQDDIRLVSFGNLSGNIKMRLTVTDNCDITI